MTRSQRLMWLLLATSGPLLVLAILREQPAASRGAPPASHIDARDSSQTGSQPEAAAPVSPSAEPDAGDPHPRPTAEHLSHPALETTIKLSDAYPGLVSSEAIDRFFAYQPRIRFRIVTVDTDQFRELVRDIMRGVDRTVTIELFPDVVLRMDTLRADENYSFGTATWSGRETADSENVTQFVMTVGPDGSALGDFVTSKGTFILRTLDHPPYHILSERPPESVPID